MHTEFWSRKEYNGEIYLNDLDINGRVILKWILKK
jgi:hypothetical protein